MRTVLLRMVDREPEPSRVGPLPRVRMRLGPWTQEGYSEVPQLPCPEVWDGPYS